MCCSTNLWSQYDTCLLVRLGNRTAIKYNVHTFYERCEYTAVRKEVKGKVVFSWTILFMEIFEGDGTFIQKRDTKRYIILLYEQKKHY